MPAIADVWRNMEKWRPVPEYEGLYEVSDLGRFKAVERTVIDSRGVSRHYKEKLLNLDFGKRNGYPCVHLSKGGKAKTINAHRIVAEVFLGKVDGKSFINHKDGDKTNCSASNLEWCTPSENARHAYQVLGIRPPRLGTCGTKFTPDEVRAIRNDKRPVKDIAKAYGTIKENIYNIRRRKTYAAIPDN